MDTEVEHFWLFLSLSSETVWIYKLYSLTSSGTETVQPTEIIQVIWKVKNVWWLKEKKKINE
jgi:hypothetical protein